MSYALAPWPKLSGHVSAADNQAMSFWQSRSNLRNPPVLADLKALARQIHKARK